MLEAGLRDLPVTKKDGHSERSMLRMTVLFLPHYLLACKSLGVGLGNGGIAHNHEALDNVA